jgi:hypothetical protein
VTVSSGRLDDAPAHVHGHQLACGRPGRDPQIRRALGVIFDCDLIHTKKRVQTGTFGTRHADVDTEDVDIAERWRLYRHARERGMSEVEAYDRYVYPGTRIAAVEVSQEHARVGAD